MKGFPFSVSRGRVIGVKAPRTGPLIRQHRVVDPSAPAAFDIGVAGASKVELLVKREAVALVVELDVDQAIATGVALIGAAHAAQALAAAEAEQKANVREVIAPGGGGVIDLTEVRNRR